jgi:hypothetical protein
MALLQYAGWFVVLIATAVAFWFLFERNTNSVRRFLGQRLGVSR